MSDCVGKAQKKVRSAIFSYTKPTVNIHALELPNVKNEYIYPSYQTNAIQDTINIQYFILYNLYFLSQFAYIHVIFWKNNLGM